jgi:FimV-like protein
LSQLQKVDDNEAYSPAIEETEFDLDTLNFDENTLDNTEEEISFEASAMDECDTKLDLAVAYEAMGDIVGALEILEEVKADGNSDQVAAARRLQQQWQNS